MIIGKQFSVLENPTKYPCMSVIQATAGINDL